MLYKEKNHTDALKQAWPSFLADVTEAHDGYYFVLVEYPVSLKSTSD